MSFKTSSTVDCNNQSERVETNNSTGTLREHFVEHLRACSSKAEELGCSTLAAEYEDLAAELEAGA